MCLQSRELTDRIWSPIGFSGSGISRIWSSRFGILKPGRDSGLKVCVGGGIPEQPSRSWGTSRNYRLGLRDWRTLLETFSEVYSLLKTLEEPWPIIRQKHQIDETKQIFSFFQGVLLDKEKSKAWLKQQKKVSDLLCQTKVFNQAKIELRITFKPAEQNLVTYLAPTLQRLAGWDGKPSKAFIPIIIIIIIINNNYSPKWRWLVLDIFSLLATDTEVNNCFSIY